MSSSGFSATPGSRLFWIIRNAASCGHARQCSSVPRGARTVRVAMLMTSILLLGHLAASGSVGLAEESRIERVAHRVALDRSEEHTSELQSRGHLVCRLLLEKKKKKNKTDRAYEEDNVNASI